MIIVSVGCRIIFDDNFPKELLKDIVWKGLISKTKNDIESECHFLSGVSLDIHKEVADNKNFVNKLNFLLCCFGVHEEDWDIPDDIFYQVELDNLLKELKNFVLSSNKFKSCDLIKHFLWGGEIEESELIKELSDIIYDIANVFFIYGKKLGNVNLFSKHVIHCEEYSKVGKEPNDLPSDNVDIVCKAVADLIVCDVNHKLSEDSNSDVLHPQYDSLSDSGYGDTDTDDIVSESNEDESYTQEGSPFVHLSDVESGEYSVSDNTIDGYQEECQDDDGMWMGNNSLNDSGIFRDDFDITNAVTSDCTSDCGEGGFLFGDSVSFSAGDLDKLSDLVNSKGKIFVEVDNDDISLGYIMLFLMAINSALDESDCFEVSALDLDGNTIEIDSSDFICDINGSVDDIFNAVNSVAEKCLGKSIESNLQIGWFRSVIACFIKDRGGFSKKDIVEFIMSLIVNYIQSKKYKIDIKDSFPKNSEDKELIVYEIDTIKILSETHSFVLKSKFFPDIALNKKSVFDAEVCCNPEIIVKLESGAKEVIKGLSCFPERGKEEANATIDQFIDDCDNSNIDNVNNNIDNVSSCDNIEDIIVEGITEPTKEDIIECVSKDYYKNPADGEYFASSSLSQVFSDFINKDGGLEVSFRIFACGVFVGAVSGAVVGTIYYFFLSQYLAILPVVGAVIFAISASISVCYLFYLAINSLSGDNYSNEIANTVNSNVIKDIGVNSDSNVVNNCRAESISSDSPSSDKGPNIPVVVCT